MNIYKSTDSLILDETGKYYFQQQLETASLHPLTKTIQLKSIDNLKTERNNTLQGKTKPKQELHY